MWMVAGIALIQFTGGSAVDALGSMAAGFALVYGVNQGLAFVRDHPFARRSSLTHWRIRAHKVYR